MLAILGFLAASSPGAHVLVLDLKALDVEPATAALINGVVASAVAAHKELQVTSADDVRQMLDLAAQKQATGCDEKSCLSEIAGAIGARYVVHGTVGKLGESLVVNLAVFDAQSATALGKKTVQAASAELVPAAIGPAVDDLLGDVPGAVRVVAAHNKPATAHNNGVLFPVGIGVAGLGALGVAGGVALAGVSGAAVYDVAHKTPQERESALGFTWVGLAVAGVGVVVTGAGAAVAYAGGMP